MQIEIDFEVFKALTSLRESESDSYNAVIRRLLGLQVEVSLNALLERGVSENIERRFNALAAASPNPMRKGSLDAPYENALAKYIGGAWFNNIHFPEGTRFRATYKGQTFLAEIKDGQWIGADGLSRTSPSDAASAISRTNVNGWRFWFVKMPGDPAWRRLDELKTS